MLAAIYGNLVAVIVFSQPYQFMLEWTKLDFKPFNCANCLSFWTWILYAWHISYTTANYELFLFAGIAFLASKLTTSELYKL